MPAGGLVTLGAITAGKGIYDVVKHGSDYNKMKAEMDKMQRPFYEVQKEYEQNRDITASMAGQGLPTATKDYYTTEAQRGLGTALGAAEMLGGTPNATNELLDTYMRNIGSTAAQDAMARTQNINEFIKRNSELAGQKTIQWHTNKMQPYMDKMAYLSGQMNIAKQAQNQGWNTIISGATGALTGMQNQQLINAIKQKVPQQQVQQDIPISNLPKPAIIRNYQEPPMETFVEQPAYNSKNLGMFNVPSQYATPYTYPERQQLLNNPLAMPSTNIWK